MGPLALATPANNPKLHEDSIIMTVLQQAPAQVLGLDVAKDTITVFDTLNERIKVIDNTAGAVRKLIAGLDPETLAVCEPTGGHERLAVNKLVAAGLACHRADTLKTKAFLRSYGVLAKTDVIDARALARYGQERWAQLALFTPPDQTRAQLAGLAARRKDLADFKVAETNRLKAPGADCVKASCRAVLRTLERELARIDEEIDRLIRNAPELEQTIATMKTLAGVGPRTAIALAAAMPELGHLTRRQAASLAGVAPHPKDSGSLRGYRKMRGGRSHVRPVLFMAALAASRANGPLRQTYQRLVANGKKPIVAIAALMRKIIVILNARLRDKLQKQS